MTLRPYSKPSPFAIWESGPAVNATATARAPSPEATAFAIGAMLQREYGGEEASRLADLVVRAVQMERRGCK